MQLWRSLISYLEVGHALVGPAKPSNLSCSLTLITIALNTDSVFLLHQARYIGGVGEVKKLHISPQVLRTHSGRDALAGLAALDSQLVLQRLHGNL